MSDPSCYDTLPRPTTGPRKEYLSASLVLKLIAVVLVAILGVYETIPRREPPKAHTATATEQAIQELKMSKQQVADQLQEIQQKLASEQAERKRLSDAVIALSNKLEALQQSFARVQDVPVAPPTEPAKRSRGNR
jgi:uncharacterized protein HemX